MINAAATARATLLMTGVVLLGLTVLIVVPACSSTDDEIENNEPSRYDVTASGQADPAPTDGAGPRQPDGELTWEGEGTAPRDRIDAELKQFLTSSLFWTGLDTIRIEAGERIVWINPNDIPDSQRYGADLVLVTDNTPRHLSSRDVEFVNDGFTKAVLPVLPRRTDTLTLPIIRMNRWETITARGVRVTTYPAWSEVPGNEYWRGHVGYHLSFPETDAPRIAYLGPMGEYDDYDAEGNGAVLEIPNAEIVIATLAPPATNDRGRAPLGDILDMAKRTNAKVLVLLGGDTLPAEEWEGQVARLDQTSDLPIWLPRLPYGVSASNP